MSLKPKYDHREIESKYYDQWVEKGYFTAGDRSKKPYSIVIPPPNVTGKLHLGHAWDGSLQDILSRYKRLQGYDVLYLPGMDHAGIATQAKVDERLRDMGLDARELGREAFLEHAWAWKNEYASEIHKQWKKMGLSLDYSRERFTLDEGFSQAVSHVFVKLYEEGLIFRGKRIINWDPQAQTALSNIEVIHKEVTGHMWTFKYHVVDRDEILEVATTRPETMFGDVCLVVHPDDARYQHLIGQQAINPANGEVLPIISDDYIDVDFGTGVMKCTPAHDPNDFLIGQKYHLEMPICMNPDGTMNALAHKYKGMDRFECRQALVEDIKAAGNFVKVEEHLHEVGHSERTDVIVEPYLSEQWFVKMKPLADVVLEHQQKEAINFYPPRFEKVFSQWLENIEDWTISRQLWWGHRIPAWYHRETGEVHVSLTGPEDTDQWVQDEDVLDTWFSSALWPFATMGWPEETDDFLRYYPTDTMVTGYDIILFWVVRMAFQGYHFTGEKPFSDVLIHGLVRDEQNRKMSKSLGNGIDPMDLIENYGVDALRFFLVTSATMGQDMRFSQEKLEAAWSFINKIYNSSRFVLMYLEDDFKLKPLEEVNLSVIDRWILDRFNHYSQHIAQLMDQYDFVAVGTELIAFIWDDFCSWYIELAKSQLQSSDEQIKYATQWTLVTVLSGIVKMIHPFMPFVSEEIYLALPTPLESLNLETWPQPLAINNHGLEPVAHLIEMIEALRKVRVDFNIKAATELSVRILDTNDQPLVFSEELKAMLYKMVKTHPIQVVSGQLHEIGLSFGRIALEMGSLIDKETQLAQLHKEQAHLQAEIRRAEKMLANENFVKKAPASKVEAEQAKLTAYQHQLTVVEKQLADIE